MRCLFHFRHFQDHHGAGFAAGAGPLSGPLPLPGALGAGVLGTEVLAPSFPGFAAGVAGVAGFGASLPPLDFFE